MLTYTYVILGKYRGKTEEIDTADDRRTAEYLVGEYQLAYGPSWQVWSKRKAVKES